MANAAAPTAPAAAAPAPAAAPKKKGKGKLIALIAVLLLAAGGGAAGYFLVFKKPVAAEGAEAAHKSDPVYLPLDPAFVVNLTDDEELRFMQADVQVMTRDPHLGETVKLHMPRIRSRLLMLFSAQRFAELNTREAKERLQQQALEEVRSVLREEAGDETARGVEALYFTSLVMQ